MNRHGWRIVSAAGILLLLLLGRGVARETPLGDEAVRCLKCHGRKGITLRFQNGDTADAYVNPGKFRSSVHAFLTCSQCHAGFSPEKHPSHAFRDQEQFRLRSSGICRKCHDDKRLEGKSIHAALLRREAQGSPAVCTRCHEAHAITPVAGGSVFSKESQYCMSCHCGDSSIQCKNGERISVRVDVAALEGSAHGKLRCSDCHFGFSSEDHPLRTFRSRRDFTIASSESCRRCHFDNYTRTLDSVHYAFLSGGNLKAPVCSDCHGSHRIVHLSFGVQGRQAITQRCRKCHEKVYETYAASVHGTALINEQNQDVPICIDCHTAHDIENPLTLTYHEKIPQMCGNCHSNPEIMGKYGLSTDVVKTYLSDFHGVTLGLYKRQREELYKPARPIAVCNDCHGTHNIMSTISSDPAFVKKNLVQRCRKCHPEATDKFPAAWLFHYTPSLQRFPLIYLVNALYRFLIPVMWIGLALQILLHAWRFAVNR